MRGLLQFHSSLKSVILRELIINYAILGNLSHNFYICSIFSCNAEEIKIVMIMITLRATIIMI